MEVNSARQRSPFGIDILQTIMGRRQRYHRGTRKPQDPALIAARNFQNGQFVLNDCQKWLFRAKMGCAASRNPFGNSVRAAKALRLGIGLCYRVGSLRNLDPSPGAAGTSDSNVG